MNAYQLQLLNPRWQRRRLEVMSKNNFSCQICDEQNQELNVHHIKYKKHPNGDKYEPWNYSDEELMVLCKDCHDLIHKNESKVILFATKRFGLKRVQTVRIETIFPRNRVVKEWIDCFKSDPLAVNGICSVVNKYREEIKSVMGMYKKMLSDEIQNAAYRKIPPKDLK
jgi:hypothetical protein